MVDKQYFYLMLCTFFCKFKPTPRSIALFFFSAPFRKPLVMGFPAIWQPCPIILRHFARQCGALYRVKQHTLRHNSIAISRPKRLSTCALAITCRLVVRRKPVQKDYRSVANPILMDAKSKCRATENLITAGELWQRKTSVLRLHLPFPTSNKKKKPPK